MIDYQVFDVASASMNREHLRMRQAADHIANANRSQAGGGFSITDADGVAPVKGDATPAAVGSGSTVEDMMVIMTSSRLYEANVTVIAAARAAFEKALEISGRR